MTRFCKTLFLSGAILVATSLNASATSVSDNEAKLSVGTLTALYNESASPIMSSYELQTSGSSIIEITKYLKSGSAEYNPTNYSVVFNNIIDNANYDTTNYYKWSTDSGENLTLETSDEFDYNLAVNIDSTNNSRIVSDSSGADITYNFVGFSETSKLSSSLGAAIYNDTTGVVGDITGHFIGNNVYADTATDAEGGAIYNSGTINDIIGDFIINYASADTDSTFGGAVYNTGTINNITGDFINNYIISNLDSYGGAVYNTGTMSDIIGDFIKNYASSSSGSAYGGAIYNSNVIGDITGDFVDNYVSSETDALGGAIYNSGTIESVSGSFIGNYASSTSGTAAGGAIYNDGTITISATTNDSIFSGNYVQSGSEKTSNAIHLESGTVNLITAEGYSITFDDAITSSNTNNIINVGDTSDSITEAGSVVFNENVSNVTINVNEGTIVLGEDGFATTGDDENYDNLYPEDDYIYTDDGIYGDGIYGDDSYGDGSIGATGDTTTVESLFSDVVLNMGDNTSIDLANGVVQSTDIDTLTLGSGVSLSIDISLFEDGTAEADSFNVTNFTSGSTTVSLSGVNFVDFNAGRYNDVIVFDIADITIKDYTVISFDKTVYITGASNGNINIEAIETESDVSSALTFDDVNEKQYYMSGDETLIGDFGTQKGPSMIIEGGGSSIDGAGYAGAVVSNGLSLSLNNVSSVSNFDSTNGAIANAGTLNINTTTSSTVFSNNEGADIRLTASDAILNVTTDMGTSVTFNSGISGDGIINKSGEGDLIINEDDAGFSGIFNLYSGSVALSTEANDFFLNAGALNVYGCLIDVANGTIMETSLGTLTLSSGSSLELGIDVNLADLTSDTFTYTSLNSSADSVILIEKINVLADANSLTVEVDISDDETFNSLLGLSENLTVEGGKYTYEVSDISIADGILTFTKQGSDIATDYNSALYAGTIAAQVAMIDSSQINTGVIFDNMNICTTTHCKYNNFYMSSYYQSKDVGFADDSYYDVQSDVYGVLVGVNGDTFYYRNLNVMFGFYIASNNGDFSWNDESLTMNGFNVGVNSLLSYKNLFLNTSLGIGASYLSFDDTDFYAYNATSAARLGYNINLNDTWTITPSVKGTYSFIRVDDYTTSEALEVETEDTFAWQISPEIELKARFSNNVNTYLKASYNIVESSGSEVDADGVIPNIERDNYIKATIGLKKELSNFWGAYFQGSIMTGGVEGYAVNAGLNFNF